MNTPDPPAGNGSGPLKHPLISVRGFTMAGAAIALAGMVWTYVIGLILPGYGAAWLDMLASVFPGYQNSGGFVDFIVGTLYAMLDGMIVLYLIAKVHNEIADIDKHDHVAWWGCWPCYVKHFKLIVTWPACLFKKRDG